MKILLITGYMLSKDFYKDCNLFGNITYFEWWKLKNPSLELFYNEIQNMNVLFLIVPEVQY